MLPIVSLVYLIVNVVYGEVEISCMQTVDVDSRPLPTFRQDEHDRKGLLFPEGQRGMSCMRSEGDEGRAWLGTSLWRSLFSHIGSHIDLISYPGSGFHDASHATAPE